MKRTFLISLLLLLFSPILVKAQVDMVAPSTGTAIAPAPPNYQTSTFLGQNQSYTVDFRGNGEAIVGLRVSLGNSGSDPIKEVKLRVPKVQPTSVYVFQILMEKRCIKYTTPVYDPVTRSYPPTTCEQYQEPDYYNSYSFYNAKYKKADYDFTNDTLTVKLPDPITANKSGAFFVYFRAVGYAKKNSFGAYDYNFETLQAEDTVRTLTVGISTDSDLYLKGVQGNVNYRFSDVSATVMKLGTGGGGELGAVANPTLDSYVNSIGQGQVYKTATNLSPLESYTVKGSYADSRAKLYGKEILIGVGVFVGIVVLFIVLVLAIVKLMRKSPPKVSSDHKDLEESKPQEINKTSDAGKTSNGKMFLAITLLGFIISLFVVIYTILVVVLGTLLRSSLGYSYQSFITLALVIISILIYLLLIFAPGILIGAKRGASWGIGTVVSTVLWVIFWVILVFVVVFLFGGGTSGGIYNFIQGVNENPVLY